MRGPVPPLVVASVIIAYQKNNASINAGISFVPTRAALSTLTSNPLSPLSPSRTADRPSQYCGKSALRRGPADAPRGAGALSGGGGGERKGVTMVGPGRPVIVLFGSSIVQYSFSNDGWGAILADLYARKADVLVRGYQGWNSRRAVQVLDRVFPKDAAIQPSLVIVYFGGNDSMGAHPSSLGPHVPLQEYVENLRKIANHLKSLSDKTRIIFLSCPPLHEEKLREIRSTFLSPLVRTNESCQRYSEACIDLCNEMDLKVIDLFNAIQRRRDWMTACFTDGIHFSADGSKIVVEEILKVLKEADWDPPLHWKSMPTEFAEDSPSDLVASDGKSTINISEWVIHREILWD